jgi:hypothetical protein
MNNNILIIIGTIVIVYFLLRNNKKTEKFGLVDRIVTGGAELAANVTNALGLENVATTGLNAFTATLNKPST